MPVRNVGGVNPRNRAPGTCGPGPVPAFRLPGTANTIREKSSEIIVLAQPVCLRRQVPVQDIALLVLETPRDDDEDIAFPDPGALLDLALDPAHPLGAILAADADMVGAHHQFGHRELFVQFLFWQPHADNRCPVGIKFGWIVRTARFFHVINANISGDIYQGRAP